MIKTEPFGQNIADAINGLRVDTDKLNKAYDHSNAIGNPHGTTKVDIGLSEVDNTSDANKPISTAMRNALDGKADLDENGKVLSSQLPSYVDDVLEFPNVSDFPQIGESGKIYIATQTNLSYRWTGSGYTAISPSIALGETSSTAYRGDRGKTAYDHSQTVGNPHHTTKADIGLGNVDNTSDASKPISTATQTALNGKVEKVDGKSLILDSEIERLSKVEKVDANPSFSEDDDTLSSLKIGNSVYKIEGDVSSSPVEQFVINTPEYLKSYKVVTELPVRNISNSCFYVFHDQLYINPTMTGDGWIKISGGSGKTLNTHVVTTSSVTTFEIV